MADNLDVEDLVMGKLYAFRMRKGKGLFPNAYLNYEKFVGRVMGAGDGFFIDLEEDDVDEEPVLVMPEDVESYANVDSKISGFLFHNCGKTVNLIVKTGNIPMPMLGTVMGWSGDPEEIIYFYGAYSPNGHIEIPVAQILEAELNPLFD
jgi:hypothetical protein